MNPLSLLSSSLGRRDEIPNQELARSIIDKKNTEAVAELMANLQPKMIAGYAKELIVLLENKNNRLQWGAITALHRQAFESFPGAKIPLS